MAQVPAMTKTDYRYGQLILPSEMVKFTIRKHDKTGMTSYGSICLKQQKADHTQEFSHGAPRRRPSRHPHLATKCCGRFETPAPLESSHSNPYI